MKRRLLTCVVVGCVFVALFCSSTIFADTHDGFSRQYSALVDSLTSLNFPLFSPVYSIGPNGNIFDSFLKRLIEDAIFMISLSRFLDGLDEIHNNPTSSPITNFPRVPAVSNVGDVQPNTGSSSANTPASYNPIAVSSGEIKIAIVDIDEQHAAEVRSVMEDTIRKGNPGADIEIRTIILPGEWQEDGSKAVASSDILNALGEAKNWGAKVVNMSIGSVGGLNSSLRVALQDLHDSGVLVVAASGNDYGAPDVWGQAGDNVLSVGALDSSGNMSYYSNYGDVYVPVTGELLGTSFAAPQVAAEAALHLAYNPTLTVADLNNILLSGSNDTMFAQIPQGDLGAFNFMPASLKEKSPLKRCGLSPFPLQFGYQSAPLFGW
ncbi:MAG: S8 family serine peptidase [Candidatus Omnitrophica bacterium]|nr:S8 family serine peptidase [Candidatus Omnitrophota bacterium]